MMASLCNAQFTNVAFKAAFRHSLQHFIHIRASNNFPAGAGQIVRSNPLLIRHIPCLAGQTSITHTDERVFDVLFCHLEHMKESLSQGTSRCCWIGLKIAWSRFLSEQK